MSNVYPHGPEFSLLLFSSHSWAHGHHRDGLHTLLAPEWKKGVDFHDLSVPEAHPLHFGNDQKRLVALLEDRIQRCDVVLVLAGMYASHSYWIDQEVQIARRFGKPILAIAPNGQERISLTATRYSNREAVRWRGSSIRGVILEYLNPWVRDDFLAAKAWRQRIRTQAVIELLQKRRSELHHTVSRLRRY